MLREQSNNDSDEAVVAQAAAAVLGTKKFLRSQSANDGTAASILNDDENSHRRLSSTHDDDSANKNEDYETLHERLGIPLPALGASLMGKRIPPSLSKNDHEDDHDELMMYKGHSSLLAFAGTNEAIQHLADLEADLEADYESNHQDTARRNLSLEDEEEEERDAVDVPRLFAFAGTNQALLNLANDEISSQETNEEGTRRRRMSSSSEEGKEAILDSTSFGTTLSQIAQSRASLLYGTDEIANDDTSIQNADASPPDAELSTFGSSLHALNSQRHHAAPIMLEHSNSDLDRGRYLVGLEVRDIQSHQQILVDYDTTAIEFRRQPLRVRYILSLGDDAADIINSNGLELLSQLMETSFSSAADIWGRALKVNHPVPNKIYPTVETCGSADVPSSDRENGVADADIVIYVSGDNRFCGGALLHSAVCDFDQVSVVLRYIQILYIIFTAYHNIIKPQSLITVHQTAGSQHKYLHEKLAQ